MSTITKERIELFIKNPLDNGLTRGEQMELARIALASLEREQIRHEHAKWSDSTFGCVGPIGPLKHLSKEALEAAAEPDDLSEWADMQFLLWDAQRRAGISDAEITAAMEDKLKINMERQWPEPKDGEPRLHIKEPGNYPVTPPLLPGGFTIEDAKELHEDLVRSHISQALSGEKMKKKDREADLRWIHGVIVQAAWFVKASLEQNALSGNSPVTPDGWISCSERMPAQDDWILIYSKHGEYMAGQVQVEYVELSDGTLSWLGNALYWMPLPEPPKEVNRG
ncbi:TPA: DUF550 domain-containing protein [Escherichia coli]|nr:DUF550 domain-containing protein [Escherichia coli]HBE3721922.1 DUF550 domain-containing protein [Escherichia coli]HBE3742823.1 DUF550 domain-containing protein [Escherichia coli]